MYRKKRLLFHPFGQFNLNKNNFIITFCDKSGIFLSINRHILTIIMPNNTRFRKSFEKFSLKKKNKEKNG